MTDAEKRAHSARMVAHGLLCRAMDLERELEPELRNDERIIELRRRAKDLIQEAGPETEPYSKPAPHRSAGQLSLFSETEEEEYQ